VSAARRAAVASLAHGLAHEINNALTPILGNAQILKMLYARDAEAVARAEQIMEHAQRIANWTASFRQVTTEVKREAIPFSLNEIVRDVMGLYGERFLRLGIFAASDLDANLPVMHGHAEQLQEVLMSVVQNAVEAMRQGGTLELRTRHADAAREVMLTVTDSGEGIRKEHLARVFEPGFTTRGVDGHSSSLGWGLFTVKQVVQAHSGTVEVRSPGENSTRGTTVRIVLPVDPDWSPL
jgi:signal transduction histidine kinase